MPGDRRSTALQRLAELIRSNEQMLLSRNNKDLTAQKSKLSAPLYGRLSLTSEKIRTVAAGIDELVHLEDPIGVVERKTELDEGLILDRVTVPLGVICIIFESRPDVIPQVLSLCLRTGNACVLKGGTEAAHSNAAFMKLITQLNEEMDLPRNWATLIETRAHVSEVLKHDDLVDLVIPRGSNALVRSVMEQTRIPVLGHAEGICHAFVHESADLGKAIDLVSEAKAEYPSACNSIETLLVDQNIADIFLPQWSRRARALRIALRACGKSIVALPGASPAKETDWATEYSDLILNVRVVRDIHEAISHIHQYGSSHTDMILAEDSEAAERFLSEVDSASVMWNATTRFADGFRYGFGAEIGISTSKTHARGPVGMGGLLSIKYVLRGKNHRVQDYSGDDARVYSHRDLTAKRHTTPTG